MKKTSHSSEIPDKFCHRAGLTLWMVILIFFMMLLDICISFGLLLLLGRLGLLSDRGSRHPLVMLALISIILGIGLSFIFSWKILEPMRKVISFTEELARGNFDIRIDTGDMPKFREMYVLTESFNHLAEELGSLEMLRSDFVNDFSHEFKTPIASIRGFAKMLQRDDLTAEEREEYLEIIVRESGRLTDLATNVLNLSKIENQTILTGQTVYNCSEQIRRMIVLLEPKWARKRQRIFLECDEVEIYANMELMEQVWINLLDNAIKFSPEDGVIELFLRKRPGGVLLSVKDCGPGIAPEAAEHIFDKFYQGEEARSEAGNGLGLAIAQRIVGLHGGEIWVEKTGEKGTTFGVRVPMEEGI
ncbi:MAG: HAMP domain-containing sensor histidine kinase [Eubacteriales bacterium]|nr:HAMP domain-containing sensor histidine kinase [Eubacteriales bacterium]